MIVIILLAVLLILFIGVAFYLAGYSMRIKLYPREWTPALVRPSNPFLANGHNFQP